MTQQMKSYFQDILKINTRNSLIDVAIYNYLMYGIPPGAFTTALLENDLFKAALTADETNAEGLAYIVRSMGKFMPVIAWGSPEKVDNWLKNKDNRCTDFRNAVVETATMMKLRDHNE